LPLIADRWQTLRGRVAGFRALSGPERRIVLVALLTFPVVAVALRVWGLGLVQRWLLRYPPHRSLVSARKLDRDCVVALVETAARTGIRNANCLERSLVLMWVLFGRGTATDLRIGARRQADEMLFHAWLEQGGAVLNDDPEIASQYAAFDGAILPEGRLV
jgi:hypothetical protein